ncbi:hypothetical protein [Parabacteroides distasonis]|uniref:hypothetical protein n=1 Tax=Parabacteroides distasonis TaxID=823 RepID=UPI00189F3189|nr:hypothetical protein [Parabacteroides distasonis]MDB9152824.1 hypothetical protein [Parabacteroides distasonis]MDB9157401.1 hypothetical protein [Parabacteroides distasonis]MDB9166416.1 hypothetical protein [Parabacteroides distasonis]MDB9170835.1 hypothetical protein [Parabacteroides distasonis]MDB9197087.1 hypothetical protein [Parabacteroides distasonis]
MKKRMFKRVPPCIPAARPRSGFLTRIRTATFLYLRICIRVSVRIRRCRYVDARTRIRKYKDVAVRVPACIRATKSRYLGGYM